MTFREDFGLDLGESLSPIAKSPVTIDAQLLKMFRFRTEVQHRTYKSLTPHTLVNRSGATLGLDGLYGGLKARHLPLRKTLTGAQSFDCLEGTEASSQSLGSRSWRSRAIVRSDGMRERG